MTEEEAFLQAIFKHLNDDAPRLAYAEWLVDNERDTPQRSGGEMRELAEFIRVQIDLARGFTADPLTGASVDLAESPEIKSKLESREKELIKGQIEGLGPEIAGIISEEPHRISFDRGFVQNLNLSNTRIAELPEGLHVESDLDLYGTQVTHLPEGLQLGGDLYLYGTRITQLPEGLRVGRDLNLYGTRITQLPEGLYVGGSLDLSLTPITQLPEGLRVGRDLNLYGTRITHLPEALHVGGDLNLRGTPITQLPEALHVGGNLNLRGTPITQLPEALHVGGNLILHGTRMTGLPDNLFVGGALALRGAPITQLPHTLQVGHTLDLTGTRLTPEAARRILFMPGLSDTAKISGLRSAGFVDLAEEAELYAATKPKSNEPTGDASAGDPQKWRGRISSEPFDGMNLAPGKPNKWDRGC